MRKIPVKMREALAAEPRMKCCAVAFLGFGACDTKIDWDHVWTYASRQINQPWAILGVCRRHHREKEGSRLLKEAICRISLHLASDEDLAQYPRKDWKQIKRSLGI